MSSAAEVLGDWFAAIDSLSFDDACSVLGDLHGVSTLVRSLELDVIGSLVSSQQGGLSDYLCPDQAITFIRQDGKEFTGLAPKPSETITTSLTTMATQRAERIVQERKAL